jgi:hypothetical protein
LTELELKRAPQDRRLYALDGVGTLRSDGLFSSNWSAEAGGRSWRLTRRGFWSRRVQAIDTAGVVVGEFEPNAVRRGGKLRWNGRELTLRAASSWRERYALAGGDRELAVLDGKGWGSRPVKVTVVVEPDAVEPGLLLFAAFVVRGLARDADGSAGGGAAVIASSSGT